MRTFAICALVAVTLSACGDDISDAERDAQDSAIAEQVREANDRPPPMTDITPEPIGYPEMEANDLMGLACSYAPGTSMGVRVIARETDAYMKIDGEMIRFASDPGSRELPAKTRSLYNSREYSLRLEVDEATAPAEGEDAYYEGTVVLRDRWDRVVYQGTGATNCGG